MNTPSGMWCVGLFDPYNFRVLFKYFKTQDAAETFFLKPDPYYVKVTPKFLNLFDLIAQGYDANVESDGVRR